MLISRINRAEDFVLYSWSSWWDVYLETWTFLAPQKQYSCSTDKKNRKKFKKLTKREEFAQSLVILCMNNKILLFGIFSLIYWRNNGLGVIQDCVIMWPFKSLWGRLNGTERNSHKILCVVKTAVPVPDETEGQATTWAWASSFETTEFTGCRRKHPQKHQQVPASHSTLENPGHKLLGKQIPVAALLMEWVNLNKIWNKLIFGAYFLKISNTRPRQNGPLVPLATGADKLCAFIYLLVSLLLRDSFTAQGMSLKAKGKGPCSKATGQSRLEVWADWRCITRCKQEAVSTPWRPFSPEKWYGFGKVIY